MLARIIRLLCINLFNFKLGYYPGMFLVRMTRKINKVNFYRKNISEFREIKMFGNSRIKVNKNGYMGGSLYWTGLHHINEFLFLNRFLKREMVFIDVGANQGEFSLFAASKLTSGKIFAFEPVSEIRLLLEHNKNLNNYNNLTVLNYGLSNKNSELPIYNSFKSDSNIGFNEGLSSLYSTLDRNTFQEIVDIKIFDDLFLNSLDRLDFIKIDIEGGELYALQGMEKSIKKFSPVILIEINELMFNSAGYSTKDIITFFENLNYKFYKIIRGNLIIVDQSKLQVWGNYILKRN